MAENRQNQLIVGEKNGVPIYKRNPSVPDASRISRRKKVRLGNEQKGLVVDHGTGEMLNMGGASFYEFEEVDSQKFVKMFFAGIKQAAGLTKAGLTVFELVYNEVQANAGVDEVKLSLLSAQSLKPDLTERTYHRGVKELIDKEFLFRTPFDGTYFVNIQFMFNGDRLAFIKGYVKKGASEVQTELQLEEPEQEKSE